MAQNYTKMWDAFLGGEWATGTEVGEDTDYARQTRDFYSNIIGPAFGLTEGEEGFGSTDLAGAYAAFSNVDLETAERTFRSEIGDPYGGGVGDPFSWEKVSRYNTEDFGGVGRLQDLLEDQLYGQGKFLGGQAGADYGTATSKGVEAYSTGMRGEREGLTYEGLTGGAGLTSGTGGSVLRSGESTVVAEDVLIEAYKKAKTLGSDYRAGSELIEQNLEGDLNDALTTYLDAIDDEKERWFSSVLSNVKTFKHLEMDTPDTAAGETWDTLTDVELETRMDLEGPDSDFYNNWSCGYGQIWDAALNDGEGGCKDTDAYGGEGGEVESYGFRDDEEGPCGIGMIWDGATCIPREELALEEDDYGYLCDEGKIDECGVCEGDGSSCADECGIPNGDNSSCTDDCGVLNGDNSSCTDDCGVPNGDNSTCTDECGVPNGDNSSCTDDCGVINGNGPEELCWDQSLVCDLSECDIDPSTIEDECGVAGGDGPQHNCLGGEIVCDESECPDTSFTDDDEEYVNCEEGFGWNVETQKCEWEGTSGWQWDSGNCHRPENSCPEGQKCGMAGICYTPKEKGTRKGKGRKKKKGGTTGKGGELIGGR